MEFPLDDPDILCTMTLNFDPWTPPPVPHSRGYMCFMRSQWPVNIGEKQVVGETSIELESNFSGAFLFGFEESDFLYLWDIGEVG